MYDFQNINTENQTCTELNIRSNMGEQKIQQDETTYNSSSDIREITAAIFKLSAT